MIRIELNDNEHFAVIMALALRIRDLEEQREPQSPMFGILAYIGHLELLRRLLDAPKLPEGQASAPNTAASGLPRTAAAVSAARQPAPVVTASEKPVAEREKAEREKALLGELTITPTKVDQPPDGASMIVHYSIRTANQERKHRMHCWDPSQFGTILETVGKSTTFLTKATKTGFVNIVGVKK
jgi:hypothetical protein